MKLSKKNSYKTFPKRKVNFNIFVFLFILTFICCSVFFLFFIYKKNYAEIPSMKSIYLDWKEKNFNLVYEKTEEILKKRPYDGEVLAMHGFAAYYIFSEQTDLSSSYPYINDSILCLRQAMYRVKNPDKPKIAYILGKAYYQKGYYFSDLAVKYLDYAYEHGFTAPDIHEFRGMAASILGDSDKAIEAFTIALEKEPSDLLLFALAENYIKIDDEKNAKLYLFETIETTDDMLLELKCRYLLGTLLLEEGKIIEAEKEFSTIIEKNSDSADAYYGLGLIYELQGDIVQARAQWRKALKIDPLHAKTREKLNLK